MITKWSPKKHYKIIASWYHAREIEAPLPEQLPEIGYIVDNKVAGWLYRTDSSVAFVDGMISNPNSLPSARRHALNVLAGVLLDTASSLGYTTVLATTEHPSITNLVKKHGFNKTNQTLYILNEGVEQDVPEYDHD